MVTLAININAQLKPISFVHTGQRCNRVTSFDPDDPLTHWLRPGDPDNDPDMTWRLKLEIYRIEVSRTTDTDSPPGKI